MIGSKVYDYVNVLDKAADASWLRNKAIGNNIANVDTPGYKRQDVDFEGALRKAIGSVRYQSVDAKVAEIDLSSLNVSTYTDAAHFSYRLDKNNVDIDTEAAELASNQLRYEALIKSMTHEFTILQSAMK